MQSNDPYNKIEVLDLTGNNLAKDLERFVDVLRCEIVPFKSVGELILVDNGFDSTIISIIKNVYGPKIRKIYLEAQLVNEVCFFYTIQEPVWSRVEPSK